MNNIFRINEFLKFFRDVVKENSELYLNQNNVYYELVRLGLNKTEEKIDNNFDYWIDKFSYSSNCKVFVDPKWKYFCQFISKDGLAQNYPEHLKLYIPLDKEHIKEGTIQIFEFLSQNNISHMSKIGKDIRIDNIVIRLINKEDAVKLINFVNNNNYIKEGLLPNNPFLFNYKGISMVVDGQLSYNGVLSRLICLYINNRKQYNKLENVDYSEFYKFIEEYYSKVFSSKEGLKILSRDFNIGYDNDEIIVNYKNVMSLMLKSLKEDFNINEYFKHYDNCIDNKKQEMKCNYVSILKYDKEVSEEEIINASYRVIKILVRKYGIAEGNLRFIEYVKTNDVELITRDFKLRDFVIEQQLSQKIKVLLNNKKISISTYIDLLNNNEINYKKYILFNAIYETYNKYNNLYLENKIGMSGKEWVSKALYELIIYKNYNGFTKDNNARYLLIENVSIDDIANIIQSELNIPIKNISNDVLKEVCCNYINTLDINIKHK